MNNPLVSIVMAAYNEERYISEAITSIITQTYENFELIIINDGSTDKTEEIILSFSDNRIKYIKNELNLKLIDSLNKGLSIAKGKYIARMDADDISLPERIEKQVCYMEANSEIGISGSHLKVFGNITGQMSYPINSDDIKIGLIITSCFGNNVVIFRKELMEKHNLFFKKDYLHAEDYKLWTEWIKYTKATNLNDCLVKYRSHSNSISNLYRKQQRKTRNKIRAEYIRWIFDIEENQSIDFTKKPSQKRIVAIQTIINKNTEKHIFKEKELKNIIFKLWYLDSLEYVESDFLILIKFSLIFRVSFFSNIKNFYFLLKHYFKFKLGYIK